MRIFLLGFMTVLMLTPVLTCAMAACPMPVSAEQQPCHQSDDADGPMLILDCMGVDLFQQGVTHDVQPDLSGDHVQYVWVDLDPDYSVYFGDIHGIRAPPDYVLRPQIERSIILTTQRFRV